MEEREEKARQIVRSIRALEGVFKTSPDPKQRERVKNDLKALKGKLSELYPDVDLNELIEAIVTDDLVAPVADKSLLEAFEYLKDIEIFMKKLEKNINEMNNKTNAYVDKIIGFHDFFQKTGADVCGENGEYHTVVYDGPLFKTPLNLNFSKEVKDIEGKWAKIDVLI